MRDGGDSCGRSTTFSAERLRFSDAFHTPEPCERPLLADSC